MMHEILETLKKNLNIGTIPDIVTKDTTTMFVQVLNDFQEKFLSRSMNECLPPHIRPEQTRALVRHVIRKDFSWACTIPFVPKNRATKRSIRETIYKAKILKPRYLG